MWDDPPKVFKFSTFTLDLARGRLLDGSKDVALRAKAFSLLAYLARERGRVIPKDELLSELWPDVTVTEDSLTQCVRDVRKALGHHAAMLRTIPRRGYMFEGSLPGAVVPNTVARAQTSVAPTDPNAWPSSPIGQALRRDGVAVLPIVLSEGDPSNVHLLDGLTHDVISRLARLRSFHVIARGSTFALRHMTDDAVSAGRALNVGYVVTGAATVQEKRIDLRIEITDVAGTSVVWTNEFTAERRAFAELIADLLDHIVESVDLQVTAAEARRVRTMPVETLDAWEMYHSALPHFYSTDPSVSGVALERFGMAIRLAPDFARAHAMKAACHYVRAFVGRTGNSKIEADDTRRSAENALAADQHNPASHMAQGLALWLERDVEGCLHSLRTAVALSPSFARGHSQLAGAETLSGDPSRGLAHIDIALSLSPLDATLASMEVTKAFALHRLGRVDEAAVWAQKVARHAQTFGTILAPAALILASAGQLADARKLSTRMRTATKQYKSATMQHALTAMSDDLGSLFKQHAARIGL